MIRSILLYGLASALLVVLLAPGVIASHTRRRAERELQALSTMTALVARTNAELQHSTRALRELARFSESRRSMLRLLGSISLALPESTAITSLRADSVGGAVVLLSPAGPALVAPLARLDIFTSVQLTGTVTREAIGPTELQRLTVRFRHARKHAASP